MKIVLKDYQEECISTIHSRFNESDRQIIQLPTGSGKTFIFLNYLARYSQKGLIICPSIELKEQILHWGKHFLGSNRISATLKNNVFVNYFVITAQSLNHQKTRDFLIRYDFDHIVIDEAHHAQSNTYKNFLELYYRKKNNFKLLGCTATPERLDGKSLLEIFGEITFSRNLVDMIQADYLCDIEAYRIKTGMKISSSHLSRGDFTLSELRKLDNDTRNEILLKTITENCSKLKTLVFCLSIDHAEKLASYLNHKGFSSACVHGGMTKKDRSDILKQFKTGEIQIVTNCQLLTEGFDEPSIQALIIARPTKSKSLYCQMLGRGIRKHESKEICYLYELTDNAHNICTFNVAAGKDPEFQHEYNNGIRLTKLFENISHLKIDDVEISKEKIHIFNIKSDGLQLPGNQIDILETYFNKIEATASQINQIKSMNIEFIQPLSFLEAAFLIWKQKLQENYGSHQKNKRQVSGSN